MKLDPGIHIVMHSVLSLKPSVTATATFNKIDLVTWTLTPIKGLR